ncbi:MAG: family 10 glycosylhydrolase [Pirellulales bacterium]|nr:family 10 glycosylhydrolase [Pirellulales bacterium]
MIARLFCCLSLIGSLSFASVLDAASNPGEPAPAREIRAFWNHSGTGAYPGDWERTAKELGMSGFNMILPNMLWGGAAHYPSTVVPQSGVYRRYGDQMEQCVEASHRHGLEVHVWKVCWNLGHLAPNEFVEELREKGRLQVSAEGKTGKWLCPSHPANVKLELQSLLEVARKYRVDGLHLDYIRYPDGNHCFCKECRRRFEKASGRRVENWPADCHSGDRREQYNAWRCEQITSFVATVAQKSRRVRPGIKISAAVFGFYPGCKKSIAQDWLAWAKEGYVDFLCPMNYTNNDKSFRSLVKNQIRLVEGRVPIYPGIGATSSHSALSPEQVLKQIGSAREEGAAGFTIFNLNEETAEKLVPALGQALEDKKEK